LPPAADEKLLVHSEMQEADFIGHAAESTDEIGKHAVDASTMGMQLLMPVRGKQELPRRGGQIEA
jgi:hypothetical protein